MRYSKAPMTIVHIKSSANKGLAHTSKWLRRFWLYEENCCYQGGYYRSGWRRRLGSLKAMKILLDTHIWIWYLSGSSRLSERYQEILNHDEHQIWLSPISIWETLVLAEKGRIRLKPEPISWVQQSLKRWPIKEAPLNIHVSIRSRQIDLPHQDPADRFIGATALIYDLTLMTTDPRLISVPWLSTLK